MSSQQPYGKAEPGAPRRDVEEHARRFDERTGAAGHRYERPSPEHRQRGSRAVDSLAERAEAFGHYLQEGDFAAMADEAADVVRRYPVQSMMVGLGLGFLLGRISR